MPVQVEIVDSGEGPAAVTAEYVVVETPDAEPAVELVEVESDEELVEEVDEITDDRDAEFVDLAADAESGDAEFTDAASGELDASGHALEFLYDGCSYALQGLDENTTVAELFALLRDELPTVAADSELVFAFAPLDLAVEEHSLDSQTHSLEDLLRALEGFNTPATLTCSVTARESFRSKVRNLRSHAARPSKDFDDADFRETKRFKSG